MSRAIAAVALGYLTLVVLILASFPAAFLALGPDRAFEPGTYDITGLWAAVTIALGFLAAVAGGHVCTTIGRRWMPARALAFLLLAYGLLTAVPAVLGGPREAKERPAEVTFAEAIREGRPPGWIALLNPLIGAAGVMTGARLRGLPAGVR